MVNYYIPLGGIIIAAVMLVWVVNIVMSIHREGMAYSDLSRWLDTPVTLPTDSLVGPRVETQTQPLQIANGGDRVIWIEWAASPVYYSQPFYPDEYKGEQQITPRFAGLEGPEIGGRIRIDPGQYIFFPSKRTHLEGVRISPLMGCGGAGGGLSAEPVEIRSCRVGSTFPGPFFEFLFSPSESRDVVLISAETGTTLPFIFSYFSPVEGGPRSRHDLRVPPRGAVTTMTCSLPPPECPDELQVQNADKNFVGCASDDGDVYKDLLDRNCLVTQSPELHDPVEVSRQLAGSEMFNQGKGVRHVYLPSFKENRFKLTFYSKGFEWIKDTPR